LALNSPADFIQGPHRRFNDPACRRNLAEMGFDAFSGGWSWFVGEEAVERLIF
jgi:hypothetical protein